MEKSASLTSPRRTRMSNTTKHPGLLDAPARQRSHAEKAADEAHQSELQALRDAKALNALDNITSVEEAMEASQQAQRTLTKKGVCPSKSRTVKDGVTVAVVPKGKRHS